MNSSKIYFYFQSIVWFFIFGMVAVVNAAENQNATPPETTEPTVVVDKMTYDDVKTMNIKQLRSFLKDRDLDCKGCTEKDDYVKMVYENQDTPKLVGLTDKMNSPPPTEEKLDQEQLDELMSKLRMNGFGNSRMFSADDLKGLSPEELQEKFSGGNPKYKSPKSKATKKDSSSTSGKGNTPPQKKPKGKDGSKKQQKSKSNSFKEKDSKHSSHSSPIRDSMPPLDDIEVVEL